MTVLGRSKQALMTFKPVFNSPMYMEIEFLFKHLMPSFCQKTPIKTVQHIKHNCFYVFVNNCSYFIRLHLLLVCGFIFSSHVMLDLGSHRTLVLHTAEMENVTNYLQALLLHRLKVSNIYLLFALPAKRLIADCSNIWFSKSNLLK